MSLALILANPQAAADGFAWECAYVKGITHDFKVLRSFFGDVGVPLSEESCCFTSSLRKHDFCEIIERFFHENVQAYILVLASHGAPVVGEIASTREGWLRFEDVFRLWVVLGHASDSSKLLFVLLDCCHSGFWVNKAARLRFSNVVVQAACSARGKSVGDYEVGFLKIGAPKSAKILFSERKTRIIFGSPIFANSQVDCGPDTSFICKWVIEQRWQPSPVTFALPQDPLAVTVAGLDVQRVGWKLAFVFRKKHPLCIIRALPEKCFAFLRARLSKLDIQAQVRLLADLTDASSQPVPTWQWWRFRPVLEELQGVQRTLMRKEALLADQRACSVFQEVRDFLACSKWDDAMSCQARYFATQNHNSDVSVRDENYLPDHWVASSDGMAFQVQWHFRHYYVGSFDLAL